MLRRPKGRIRFKVEGVMHERCLSLSAFDRVHDKASVTQVVYLFSPVGLIQRRHSHANAGTPANLIRKSCLG